TTDSSDVLVDLSNFTTSNLGAGSNQLNFVDTTPPTILSIDRQNPTAATTNADAVTFRVTFSEPVQNVDASDFTVAGTTATIQTITPVGASAYDTTISGGDLANLNGTVTLTVNPATQNIVDNASLALSSTTPTGTNNNTYTLDNAAPPTPVVTHVGDGG